MKIMQIREIANVAATLSEGLRRLGHEVTLRPMTARKSEGAVDISGLPRRLAEAYRIDREVRRGRFDVVHMHWAHTGWLGILGRYPYFLHCHGFDLARNLDWPLLGWVTRVALRRAQRVFYSTPDLARYAESVRKDAAFIPNPIDLQRFTPAAAREGRGERILMMSRFEAKKGTETATAMVRRLRQRHPEVHVDAFDWGVLKPRSLNGDFNLIPRVPYGQMPSLFAGYDVIIGQFKLGIVSMSELEAMASGRPVVSFFDYPQVYDEPPPLFSTRDPEEGAETLARLLDDPDLRRQSGEAGRAWVEKHHECQHVAGIVEGHYREVLGV
ncbi:MAG: glycosyltransferase family 4 protein [Dehalococcoidia bacterium]